MDIQYLSVIVFVGFVVAETIISARKGLALYDRRDSQANVVMGVLTFLSKMAIKGVSYLLYFYLYEYAIFEIPEDSIFWFIIGFLLNDFLFYWYHRMSHEVRMFWAIHVTHHSSPKLNITTAMRGSFVNNIFHTLFWAPLALIGFSPYVIITSDAFSYFYQLWLHTRIVPKLGFYEWAFNTPSHHRVHHGSNEQYLDKNYGAVLILWDRMFGTFAKEEKEVTYGLTKPINSYNPIKLIFHECVDIYRDIRRTPTFKERMRILLRRPGYSSDPFGVEETKKNSANDSTNSPETRSKSQMPSLNS